MTTSKILNICLYLRNVMLELPLTSLHTFTKVHEVTWNKTSTAMQKNIIIANYFKLLYEILYTEFLKRFLLTIINFHCIYGAYLIFRYYIHQNSTVLVKEWFWNAPCFPSHSNFNLTISKTYYKNYRTSPKFDVKPFCSPMEIFLPLNPCCLTKHFFFQKGL